MVSLIQPLMFSLNSSFDAFAIWLIEQFYYVTFWHSKVKTNTFIKYHTPAYGQKHTIKKSV